MRPGDVILQVDRHEVDSARAAAAALAKAEPADPAAREARREHGLPDALASRKR